MTAFFTPLADRSLLRISGPDGSAFLQGLITADTRKLNQAQALYGAMLTPQGKFLHDFFLLRESEESILLDVAAERIADLAKRLGFYKLRSKVEIAAVTDRTIGAVFGKDALSALGVTETTGHQRTEHGHHYYTDPRLPALGARVILAGDGTAWQTEKHLSSAPTEAYEQHRLNLGIPDGARDLIPDKSFILEYGFEALNGVDFAKGCYVGQEVTARSKYRGVIRKSLYRVTAETPLPAPDTPVMLGEKEAGTLRSSLGNLGLALLRDEMVAEATENRSLTIGAHPAVLERPVWGLPPVS